MLKLTIRYFIFVALLIFIGELFFRYVVVSSNTAYKIMDPEFNILLHDTSGTRTGIYTTGRFAQHRTRWYINRQGWKSDRDYEPPSPNRKPVIGIIGDSYIAGFQVEDKDHLTTRLDKLLQGQYHVYNFGQGGSCSSQFLHIAMYAEARFDPDIYVILVRDSDWKQSITYYIRDQRIWQLRATAEGFKELPASFEATRWRRLPKYSALIRYFVYNVNLDLFGGVRTTWRQRYGTSSAGPSPSDPGAPSIKAGMDYLVRRIRQELPGKDIIFMSDAFTANIYSGREPTSQSSLPWLREICEQYDCRVFDLAPSLIKRYAEDGRRFDFEVDYHWNAYGHRVIAESLFDYLNQNGLVNPTEEPDLQVASLEPGTTNTPAHEIAH
ncbi:MAG: SGNH/GDSL hydrolase family protein [Calditrichota bacterium]